MRTETMIDVRAFLERVGYNPALAREVIRLFLAEAPQLLAEIQKSIRDHNNSSVASAAHAIKGSIGNFSGERAYELALELEMMGHNDDLSKASTTFCSLEHETALLISELQDPQIIDRIGTPARGGPHG